ncbi:DUF2695 domain-containing protein [Nocardioides eburneiflavus]|uniref:DUF2695 domain-containing protein n=1 Tax=Nocardioides eburneiflavus TaxID=2518372 RepID=UPI003CCC76E9
MHGPDRRPHAALSVVPAFGCCTTLRFATRYRDLRAPRAVGLERRLGDRGGFCDCEIHQRLVGRTSPVDARGRGRARRVGRGPRGGGATPRRCPVASVHGSDPPSRARSGSRVGAGDEPMSHHGAAVRPRLGR